ncbi:hypothetical protein KCV01_g3870, partial [Aureobasidium melanogenum]
PEACAGEQRAGRPERPSAGLREVRAIAAIVEFGQAPAVTEGIGADGVAILLRGEYGRRDGWRQACFAPEPAVVEIERYRRGCRSAVDHHAQDRQELVDRGVARVRVAAGIGADMHVTRLLTQYRPGHALSNCRIRSDGVGGHGYRQQHAHASREPVPGRAPTMDNPFHDAPFW